MRPTLFVLAALLASSACADDWSKSYQVSGRPELRVDINDGRITLKSGPGGAIEVHLTTS